MGHGDRALADPSRFPNRSHATTDTYDDNYKYLQRKLGMARRTTDTRTDLPVPERPSWPTHTQEAASRQTVP